MRLAGTGHRSQKIGGFILPNPTYIYICQQIEKHLKELKPDSVISGGAIGFDQYLANVAINLGIPLTIAVPFKGQELKWPEKSQKQYHKLLNKASDIVIVSDGGYSAQKMRIRNEWMINNCDIVLACWDGSKGGTFNCINYAKSVKKNIIMINI